MKQSFLSLIAGFLAGVIGLASAQAADVIVPGFLKFEAYANIPGGSPQDLLGDPSYPNSPTETRYLLAFNTRVVYPDDSHGSYGARITGFVTPPQSGNYQFFLRSDDGGQLWLSTDDNPANLEPAPIAEEPTGCCNNFLETGEMQTSVPKTLVAGKRYYVMAIYKEGVGGDFCQVAWRKAGDTTPADQLSPIPAAYLSVSLPAAGDVKISRPPANTSAAVNDYATFSVGITTTNSPMVVQWYKNGTVLPGVTGQVVSLGPLAAMDNNAKITAVASVPGAFATSAEATLTTTPDVTPPRVLAVIGTDTFNAITVTFSEAVNAASAGTALNYTLDGGLTVSGATVLSPTQVRLATSKQTVGEKYVLGLKNIVDSAGVSIAADAKHSFSAFSIVRGGLKFEAYSGINGTAIQVLLDATSQYPNKPDVVGFTSQFTSRLVYADATHDNYGGRLSGWLVPSETANYEFFLRSDNAGQLYLSKDDKPETAVLIAEETGRANQFLEPGEAVPQTSKPIALMAGQRYFIYALWKAGGGGDSFQRFDYGEVAWRKVGDSTAAQTLPFIPGSVLETYAAEGTFTPPTVSVASPSAFTSFDVGAPVTLTANTGAATNKTVVKVEYFESKRKIGEATRAPFAVTLFGLAENAHTLIAKATDSAGITAESLPVTFSVGGQRETVPLLAIDAVTTWKYDRSGTDLGTAWREKTYDDSAWPQGPSLLGRDGDATVEPIRTLVNRFDDAGVHITTFYFRTHFAFNKPVTPEIKLLLRHVLDDGAVFYLNGVEIHRFGIAAGAPFDFNTFFGEHEDNYEGPFDIPPTALVQGDNVIAAEVHQVDSGSSDFVFGAELVASLPVVPVVKTLLGIDAVTDWKYDRSGTDLGTAWRGKVYDDSAWPHGPSLLGRDGDATVEPIRTLVNRFDDAGVHITTFYFRTHFSFDAPVPPGIKLVLRHVVDDGAVFYLNGVEIHRFGIAAGAPFDFTTFFGEHEDNYEGPFDISPTTLVQGDNVMAAEVHQVDSGSSDFVFGAELVATYYGSTGGGDSTPLKLSIARSGTTAQLSWTGTGTLQSSDKVNTGYADVQNATNPLTVPLTGNAQFYRVIRR